MIILFRQHAGRVARRLAPALVLLAALLLATRPTWAQG